MSERSIFGEALSPEIPKDEINIDLPYLVCELVSRDEEEPGYKFSWSTDIPANERGGALLLSIRLIE